MIKYIKDQLEPEISALKRIIQRDLKNDKDCTHEKGELYALEWVLTLLNKVEEPTL